MRYQIAIKDRKFDVEVVDVQAGVATVLVNGESYAVTIENYAAIAGAGPISGARAAPAVTRPAAAPSAIKAAPQPVKPAQPAATAAPGGGTAIIAPIPGLMLEIKVKVGDTVTAGQTVAILEAMKMENNIATSVSGRVMDIVAAKGAQIGTGDMIMIVG
ncbi:MAG: acetyl-CoA carboxylase biotin carboxyl carrier protein subunit [Candidatus Rokubacteria bacterium]|nr:acetyl-CoA carboxylase biotin carboxyl carrier protein subunit [Candidatus Rokubacteria bacterium]